MRTVSAAVLALLAVPVALAVALPSNNPQGQSPQAQPAQAGNAAATARLPDDLLAHLRENARLQREFAERQKIRHNHGEASQPDLLKAGIAVATAERILANAEADAVAEAAALAELVTLHEQLIDQMKALDDTVGNPDVDAVSRLSNTLAQLRLDHARVAQR